MSVPPSDAFQRALDEADRNDRKPHDVEAGRTGAPRVRGVAFGDASGAGGKARFGLALDWTDEPATRPPRPHLPPGSRPRAPAIRRPGSRRSLALARR